MKREFDKYRDNEYTFDKEDFIIQCFIATRLSDLMLYFTFITLIHKEGEWRLMKRQVKRKEKYIQRRE